LSVKNTIIPVKRPNQQGKRIINFLTLTVHQLPTPTLYKLIRICNPNVKEQEDFKS